MDEELKHKYGILSAQLKEVTNILESATNNLTNLQTKIKTNILINKEIPYKNEFQNIKNTNNNILKATKSIYHIVKNKK